MTEQPLIVDTSNHHIAVITFNRPHAMNSLDVSTMQLFAEAIDKVAQDEHVRVLILTGAGERAFSTGGDLNDLADKSSEADAQYFITTMGDALLKMEQLPIPVIGAMNGYTLGGGCEIALACDMRIADETVRFGLVQLNMGVTPGWGAGQRLMRVVGYAKAMQLLLEANVMEAPEIEALGLINQIVEAGQAFEYAMTLAQDIASRPPDAVQAIKRLLQASLTQPYEQALQTERDLFPSLWTGQAHQEAVNNFLNRRQKS